MVRISFSLSKYLKRLTRTDVIMEYAFARSDRRLEHPEFDPVFMEAFSAAGDLGHWTLHMNWILQTLQALPEWMAKAIVPG
jgi:hypothetical protein